MIFKYKESLQKDLIFTHIIRVKNKKTKWLPTDSEDRFLNLLKEHPNSKHLNNYLKNPISYQYNDYGFRTSDSFNTKDLGNIFLGCSHTFGVGHHLENVWSYKLSNFIGNKFFNIAEPGSGIMTQYRHLLYFIDKLNVKNVFHYLPDEDWYRYEYVKKDETFGRVVHEQLSPYLIDTFFNEKQIHLLNYVYIEAIRQLLNSRGIKYFLYTNSYASVENMNPYHKEWTPARDLIHYYVEEQDELYKIFKHKYENNLTDNQDNNFLINGINPLNPKLL